MNEVLKSITEAEAKAAEIKAEALEKASVISANAEIKAEEIAKKCETDCKLYRETQIKKAEKDAEANYQNAIADKKTQAKTYADGVLKGAEAEVDEIVRRISRGSC